jgi:hypothetical protein
MVHPRHGLYLQDENIHVFILGFEKEEKESTTRFDKVAVSMVSTGPHPIRPSGEDGTPTFVTGGTQRTLPQFTEELRRI